MLAVGMDCCVGDHFFRTLDPSPSCCLAPRSFISRPIRKMNSAMWAIAREMTRRYKMVTCRLLDAGIFRRGERSHCGQQFRDAAGLVSAGNLRDLQEANL